MVNSKQLTNKSRSTPKMSLRYRSVMQNTSTTSVQSDDNNDELVNTIRGIIKEELEEHEKKLNEILKSQLQNTNELLDKISNKVHEITKNFVVLGSVEDLAHARLFADFSVSKRNKKFFKCEETKRYWKIYIQGLL